MKVNKSSYSISCLRKYKSVDDIIKPVEEIPNGHNERKMRSRHRGGHGPQISDLNEKGEMT